MADNESGRFRRFRFWLYRYDLEVGLGALVVVVSWTILRKLDTALDDAFSDYQAVIVVCAMLILFVATATMFNAARTRASAAQMLDELRGKNGRKR